MDAKLDGNIHFITQTPHFKVIEQCIKNGVKYTPQKLNKNKVNEIERIEKFAILAHILDITRLDLTSLLQEKYENPKSPIQEFQKQYNKYKEILKDSHFIESEMSEGAPLII